MSCLEEKPTDKKLARENKNTNKAQTKGIISFF